ncbi:putative integral membrane protein [Streptomyces ambofaciens ATCC 23877]|uniref:Putative integral membrane protein n=1 Tax=Streptomyces ambofaciens (strain ATCC 23877 / 3486 / DSM 40053 / JCM 4204 / NBRC 12836 / NRRL B-2516) TaxID=278992 RepID=A0AE77_STRA7|nr:hypothetical protein [Streptomyces ambofaciens]AKZ59540.1 putative integral membrane protein [Streptomyces ambofaciens ATCC 23877]CAJ88786.1 putative integral membrane protein [Streptomyces ambofaciens ATCC 23877]
MSRTRGTWNTRGTWLAGIALAAVVALTGYAVLAGGGDDEPTGKGTPSASSSATATAGPAPDYTVPDDWTEPEQWAALPRGSRTDKYGSEVGYPHTTEGAVSMAVNATNTSIEPGKDAVDGQVRVYNSYISAADHSDQAAQQIEQAGQETDKKFRRQMGVPADGEMPPGSYVRTTVIGFKVLEKSDDEVSVWLLGRVAMKKGELEKESISHIRLLMGARWEDGDWKLSGQASVDAQKQAGSSKPGMAVLGDAQFSEYGWVAIREAS